MVDRPAGRDLHRGSIGLHLDASGLRPRSVNVVLCAALSAHVCAGDDALEMDASDDDPNMWQVYLDKGELCAAVMSCRRHACARVFVPCSLPFILLGLLTGTRRPLVRFTWLLQNVMQTNAALRRTRTNSHIGIEGRRGRKALAEAGK